MGESSALCLMVVIKLLPCIYLALTIDCHNPSSVSSFHHHLDSRLMFIFLISLMPKPPLCLLLQITFHWIRWYFFLDPLPCQKKVLLCLSRISVVVLGRKYMDIWYIKVLERLELISVSLPAMDKELPFHVDSFFRFFLVKVPSPWYATFQAQQGLLGI